MVMWAYIFWISCGIVLYNYAGYAILVFFANKLLPRRETISKGDYTPSVSFIVAAWNEEDFIREKILNSIEQQYPRDKIEFVFITDGSTDRTNEIVTEYPAMNLLFLPERKGKSAAINRAVSMSKNDILIFSDANTFLNNNATLRIAQLYEDPQVGGVAGEKKVMAVSGDSSLAGGGEGAYWKYESFLKKLDSDFYSVVGAAGELFSLRRELYEPIPHDVILDDFVISLKVAAKGYRILYEPAAYAMESPSFSLKDESKRKIRIAAGGFQAMAMLTSLFRFWKHPKLSFLYISHRVLRWTLSPLCLILALAANSLLFFNTYSRLYAILFFLQIAFYLAAFVGGMAGAQNSALKPLRLAYYFVFMNVSVILGFFRYLRGRQSAAWEKARRSSPVPVK